jgi:hypothetical protein
MSNVAGDSINVACQFKDAYMCGYVSETIGELTWQRLSGQGPNLKTSPSLGASGDVTG